MNESLTSPNFQYRFDGQQFNKKFNKCQPPRRLLRRRFDTASRLRGNAAGVRTEAASLLGTCSLLLCTCDDWRRVARHSDNTIPASDVLLSDSRVSFASRKSNGMAGRRRPIKRLARPGRCPQEDKVDRMHHGHAACWSNASVGNAGNQEQARHFVSRHLWRLGRRAAPNSEVVKHREGQQGDVEALRYCVFVIRVAIA